MRKVKEYTSAFQLAEAYGECRRIARKRARNFYYAFLALPLAKRDAICAVYAFMRRADDIADDNARSREDRSAELKSWLAAWHATAEGQGTSDPVFFALRDAAHRFRISGRLLDQLVQGTAMDLERSPARLGDASEAEGSLPFRTFDDLYQYCYLVASVVGLVCIRIFGYSDPKAEKLAEETGIAFQLTNILRDIKEDAAVGRVYLPQADLAQFRVSATDLGSVKDGTALTAEQRRLLEYEARRALDYYASADALLPLIARDSRPALWVLVRIYRRLLEEIIGRNYDVFSERIKVSATQKYLLLVRGLTRTIFGRKA